MVSLRRYLMAGLLIWLPILATIFVLRFLINILESILALLPTAYQPHTLLGFHIPGISLIISIVVLLITGMLVTNYIGHHLVALWEKVLAKIPFVRTIYSTVKQVLETVLSTDSNTFRQVLLVEFPRKGIWSIAFQAGEANQEIIDHVGCEMMTVFIPNTPNPTTGFLLMVPKADVKSLNMSVESAIKYVISLGVMQPNVKDKS